MLAQTVIVAIGAIGMTMIIVSGGIDLSVGASSPSRSVVTAIASARRHGRRSSRWPPESWPGGIIGLINGSSITTLRVVPFIATLGMLGVARGVAKYVADEQTVNPPATWLNELAVTFPSRDLDALRPRRLDRHRPRGR